MRAGDLLSEGMFYLNARQYEEAIQCFLEALEEPADAEMYIRNNLALALCYVGEFERADRALTGNAALKRDLNPFYYALLSMIKGAQKYERTAKSYFIKSCQKYDQIYSHQADRYSRDVWETYAYMVMKAGAVSEMYEDCLSFYSRFGAYFFADHMHDLAAQCAFNMKKYDQALNYWLRMETQVVPREALDRVLSKFEQGELPPFIVPFTAMHAFDQASDIELFEYALDHNEVLFGGPLWIMLRHFYDFDNYNEKQKDRVAAVEKIVYSTGDWGVQFAYAVLEDAELGQEEKRQALSCLRKMGVEYEGIAKDRRVFVLRPDDLVSHMIRAEVAGMLERGGREHVQSLLEERFFKEGISTPELLLIMIDLQMESGKWVEAKKNLKLIESFDKNYAGVKERLSRCEQS